MRSPEMFGGMPPQETKKTPESEKSVEMVPYGELLTMTGEQMMKVTTTLERERKLAADIRGMGGKVTKETADKIMDLERQKNALLEVYEKTLEPVRKDAAEAFLDKAEWLVPKPEDLDKLMTDPEEMEVTDDMLIETQTSEQLSQLEKDLTDEADKAREEMAGLIEQIHKTKNEAGPLIPDFGDPEIRKSYRGLMEARYKELEADVATIERLKGQGLLPENGADVAKQEMRNIDAVVLKMMTEDIEEVSAREKAAQQEELKNAYVGILAAKFGELHSYVRSIDSKLAEVRFNLGFAKKMDEKEGRMAA